MAASSGKELKDAVLGQYAPEGTSAAESLVKAAFAGFKACLSRGLDALAAANVSVTADDSLGVGVRITGVKFVPSAALTSDNSSYVSVQLVSNDGAGGADTVIATANSTNAGATLGTGSWVANVGEALTITADNARVAAGKQLQVRFLKYGSGVNVPSGTVVIKGDWE